MPTLFQISIQVNSGTIGRIAEQIGQIVINHGWKSYITYARNCLYSTSETIKIGNKLDIYWHGINTRLLDNHCLCSKNATKKLIKQIKQIKPDIIQIHNIHGYYLNMKILFDFLKNSCIPVVWTLHDCWSFTGHCVYFDYIDCNKWVTGCYKCPQKGTYPASILLDRSHRNYQIKKQYFTSVKNMTTVSVSYWLGELVKKSFLNKYPIRVIYNGINTDIFCPVANTDEIKRKYGIENKIILLGVASTWSKRKGFDDFIALNNIIDHEIYKIVLVGLNNNQIKKLSKEIIGIKRTESVKDLVALYSAADVHISCSVEETFGLTIVESMACGTPVIAYNCTAIPELIDDNTGFIVNRGDINSIYNYIKKIHAVGKNHFSENCRKKATNKFNSQNRYNEYLSLYNQLLNGTS
jgi:glycosyltransferase involved in cell wall biosynthesis